MGVFNAELFTNLGLCCFYAQQYDHTISCFERALDLATEENIADVWYNISHVAIVSFLQCNGFACTHSLSPGKRAVSIIKIF